jgi:hypothetical protein
MIIKTNGFDTEVIQDADVYFRSSNRLRLINRK